ncbi:hypothetical protein ACGFK1_21325 [Mycobacterium sp. NPDC048908]|uniref:hypothetical protein n=1 Tax=Mycobacterium sp. NPDC048908 TaxID=3364292 RepID=UPI003719FE02
MAWLLTSPMMASTLGSTVAVQPMVADGVEVSVGFVGDDIFGPLLVVAAVVVCPLAGVIVAFSRMAVELGDVADAVEANPLIVSEQRVVAVDALVQMRRAES